MPFNINPIRILLICICFCGFITFLISVLPVSLEECNCENYDSYHKYMSQDLHDEDLELQQKKGHHRLAVLVPFRDRFDELLEFAPHMHKFLSRQHIDHHIFILNQVDLYRFNRASLINVGFLYTKKDFDYIAMHDVDLLPLNDNLLYKYPADGPFHIASPKLHPKYHYETFVGGILLLKREDFLKVNGMSNQYWGWGLEDDEFYVRMKDAELIISRPEGISTETSAFSHIHDRSHRKRDTQKCFNQKEVTRKRDRETGLNNIKHRIIRTNRLVIDGTPVTIVNIALECDMKRTPWCNCSASVK